MYLSKEAVTKRLKSSKRLLLVGGIFAAIGLYGIIVGLSGNANLRTYLRSYIVLFIMFAAVFALGVFNRNQLKLPKQFGAIFSTSTTGIVPVSQLAKQLKLSNDKTLAELERAINRGYLVNCYLDQSGTPAVILTNINAAETYITVTCPNCGGANQVRVGFAGTCAYCNSPLSGKETE